MRRGGRREERRSWRAWGSLRSGLGDTISIETTSPGLQAVRSGLVRETICTRLLSGGGGEAAVVEKKLRGDFDAEPCKSRGRAATRAAAHSSSTAHVSR